MLLQGPGGRAPGSFRIFTKFWSNYGILGTISQDQSELLGGGKTYSVPPNKNIGGGTKATPDPPLPTPMFLIFIL